MRTECSYRPLAAEGKMHLRVVLVLFLYLVVPASYKLDLLNNGADLRTGLEKERSTRTCGTRQLFNSSRYVFLSLTTDVV